MIPDFAELCLMLYVLIDDHYRALPAALKPRGTLASRGGGRRVMRKKQTRFGDKLHLLVTLGGVIRE